MDIPTSCPRWRQALALATWLAATAGAWRAGMAYSQAQLPHTHALLAWLGGTPVFALWAMPAAMPTFTRILFLIAALGVASTRMYMPPPTAHPATVALTVIWIVTIAGLGEVMARLACRDFRLFQR